MNNTNYQKHRKHLQNIMSLELYYLRLSRKSIHFVSNCGIVCHSQAALRNYAIVKMNTF